MKRHRDLKADRRAFGPIIAGISGLTVLVNSMKRLLVAIAGLLAAVWVFKAFGLF